MRRLATFPELLDLANGGSTLLRNVCTVHVYKSPRHSIPKEVNCHWRFSCLYATQRRVFFLPIIILELRNIWINFAKYKPNVFSTTWEILGHSYLITQLGILYGCVSKCLSLLVVMRSRLSNELSCLGQNMD